MLDGRQVAIVTALTEDDTERAAGLLTNTAPGDPWEQTVTAYLTALWRRDAGQHVDNCLGDLVNTYLSHKAKPGLTVFDVRLGLTALDALEAAQHPEAGRLVQELVRRTEEACDGYAAREFLVHPLAAALATARQAQGCRDLIGACALEAGALPNGFHTDLSVSLNTAEAVLTQTVTTTRSGT